MDALKNFSYSTVATAPSPATSGTSLVVTAAQGSRYPATPFNASVWPVGTIPDPTNAEIVRVTAVATDTLTITRAQESTTARSIVVGDQIAATITVKTLTDILAIGSAVGSGTPGSVLFADVSGNLGQDNANLFWDDANNRFGIGTSGPQHPIHFHHTQGDLKVKDLSGFLSSTDIGVVFDGAGALESGLFTEVNGAIASYGINVPQMTTRDTATTGGIFRLDTRSGPSFANGGRSFIILGYPTGGSVATSRMIVSLESGTTALVPVSGFVGIATTAPGAMLEVAGLATVKQAVSVSQVISAGQSAYVPGAVDIASGITVEIASGGILEIG